MGVSHLSNRCEASRRGPSPGKPFNKPNAEADSKVRDNSHFSPGKSWISGAHPTKRILIISESTPDGFTFMTGSSLLGQLDSLRKLHDLTIIAPFVLPLPRSKANIQIIKNIFKIKKRGIIDNVVFYRPWFFGLPLISQRLNDFLKVLLIFICIKVNKIKFDIIHAHYAHPPGFVAVLLAKIVKKTVIITCRGSDIHEYTEKNYPDKLRRERVLYAIKNADYLTCVSNFLSEKIVSLGIDDTKVEVVPNGVNSEMFYPIKIAVAREKLKLPLDKKIILNVGMLTPIKGTIYLINAFADIIKKNDGLFLIIIGHGPLRSELENKVRTLNLNRYVRFVSFVPNEELVFWFNAADLFVLPSLGEGFGIVLIEALSCGLPIVASNVGGIPEIINESNLGILISPGNIEELSNGILQGLNNNWNRNKLIERSKYYSWDNVAKLTSNIYERF